MSWWKLFSPKKRTRTAARKKLRKAAVQAVVVQPTKSAGTAVRRGWSGTKRCQWIDCNRDAFGAPVVADGGAVLQLCKRHKADAAKTKGRTAAGRGKATGTRGGTTTRRRSTTSTGTKKVVRRAG